MESTDSVASWFQQSQNNKLELDKRTAALQKAYDYTNTLLIDSIKSNYYSKISFEADNLNSEQLFREVSSKALSLATTLRDTFKIGDVHWNYASFILKKRR